MVADRNGAVGDHAHAFPALKDNGKNRPRNQRALEDAAQFSAALALADRLPSYERYDSPSELWLQACDALTDVRHAQGENPDVLLCYAIRDGLPITAVHSGMWDEEHEDIATAMQAIEAEEAVKRIRAAQKEREGGGEGSGIDWTRDHTVRSELASETYEAAAIYVTDAHTAALARAMSEIPSAAESLGTSDPHEIYQRLSHVVHSGQFAEWARDPRNASSGSVSDWLDFCESSHSVGDAWDIWVDEAEDRHRY